MVSKLQKTKRILAGLAVVLFLLIAGYSLLRPFHLRWGATAAEAAAPMPGDLTGRRWTRAITIEAAPEAIWPWLLQWGQGRGGWYSYDWLENLFGFDIHTAGRILPQFQNLQIGDDICMAKNVCTSQVSILEPNQWLGWETLDEKKQPVWNFTIGLAPAGEQRTRLIIRESFSPNAMPPAALTALEIPDVVMEQKALATLKDRAEGRQHSVWVTIAEIGLWLAAFAIGLAAGYAFVNRVQWKLPLAVGAAAVAVLLVLTFLFPPLWLRALLDIGLLAGLLAARKQ